MNLLRTFLFSAGSLLPATLPALDHNRNGVSDVWEAQYPGAANFAADNDGDGFSNLAEGRAWTDPNDPASFFPNENFSIEDGIDQFVFPGERWMRDVVWESTDLRDWFRRNAPQQSDGSPQTITRPHTGPKRFYNLARHEALNSDTDALTNKEEEYLGTNPEQWDSDGDKVPDDIEFLNGTDPRAAADTDGDGMPDDFERWCIAADHGDSITDLAHVTNTSDFDGDTISDRDEFTLGTSPVTPLRNVLFFITEDQSLHLGLYDTNPAGGYAGDSANPADNRTRGLDTPHLDNLGHSGAVFDRAFCLSPVCSPSKMALYTGTFPHTNSAHRNVSNYGINFPLPSPDPSNLGLGGVHEDLPTLIEIFRDRGWYTAVSSKSHVQPIRKFPYHKGHPNLGTPTAAANALDDVITQAGDRPFFFWANLGSPHLPFKSVPTANGAWSGPQDASGHVTNIDTAAIDVPDCYPDVPEVRQDIADYLGNIKIIDDIFQACIDKLAERGADGETVIFFTSDHGLGLHRAKQSIYSTGLQIPFLVAGPGVNGGIRTREPVSHLDLAPTLLELVGSPQMPSHLGKSLWPILNGSQSGFPDRHTMLTACHRYYNARAVCDGRYYYARNLTQPTGGTLANPSAVLNADQYTAGSPWFNRTYAATVAATGTPQHELLRQIVEGGLPNEELFDLDADLWCTNNLADDPAYTTIKAKLQQELSRWRRDTEDYNLIPSEMTRRHQRFVDIDPPVTVPEIGAITRSDSFDDQSGPLDTASNWDLRIAGNSSADFTLGEGTVDAPAGPRPVAQFSPRTLSATSSFTVSVKTGFASQGVGSGIAFGIVPDGGSHSYWQFLLADGRSSPGGINKDVHLARVTQGANPATVLLQDQSLPNYPAGFAPGDLFTVEVSGRAGSPLVDLRILDPSGATYYRNTDFNLGSPVPADSGFGITTWSSGTSVFDDFSVSLLTSDFESTGNLDAHPDWTTSLFGNSSADFTFVAAPFSGTGQSLTAGPGPLMLATFNPVTLTAGRAFEASLDVGFPASGIFGGLVFGHSDPDNWFSLELANGNTNNGLVLGRLFRIRQRSGGTFTTLLSPAAHSLPIIAEDRYYRLAISGQEGSAMIDYQIRDANSGTVLTNGTLDLGTPLTTGTRFGVTANSSSNTHYDNLLIESR